MNVLKPKTERMCLNPKLNVLKPKTNRMCLNPKLNVLKHKTERMCLNTKLNVLKHKTEKNVNTQIPSHAHVIYYVHHKLCYAYFYLFILLLFSFL